MTVALDQDDYDRQPILGLTWTGLIAQRSGQKAHADQRMFICGAKEKNFHQPLSHFEEVDREIPKRDQEPRAIARYLRTRVLNLSNCCTLESDHYRSRITVTLLLFQASTPLVRLLPQGGRVTIFFHKTNPRQFCNLAVLFPPFKS